MRNPLSNTIVTIPPSGIRKFFDIVSEMEGAISLGVGEPDFDTPWHVRDAGIRSLEMGIQSVGSMRGHSSHEHNPFVILSEKPLMNFRERP